MIAPSRGSGQCLVCGGPAAEPFLELHDVPVHPNVLCPTAEEARRVARSDVVLTLCGRCELIWNARFDPSALSYGPEYENSLHFSAEFRRYGEALADRLIARYGLEGGRIAEVGCGKGEFLAILCERGGASGIGFDPSYAGEVDDRADGRLTFVRDVLRDDSDLGRPALVVCRHVVEHLSEPVETLRAIRTALGEDPAVLYVEVPAAEYLLHEVAIWDVIYPHVLSLTAGALRALLERAGFDVLAHGYSFEGQYLWAEATTETGIGSSELDDGQDVQALVRDFARRAEDKRVSWTRRLHRLVEQGPVALWGLGAKGTTFLNLVADGNAVGPVVDVNPSKHGCYVPGTGQLIEGPDVLADRRPETVILTNPIYRTEVEGMLRHMGIEPAVVVA